MAEDDWFISGLEHERERFAREEVFPPSRLLNFKSWSELLSEDEDSLNRRSSAARSVRRRARSVLNDFYTVMGLEVFVLSTFATSMTKIRTVDVGATLPRLRRWWDDVPHPQSLTDYSKALVKQYDISKLLASTGRHTPEIAVFEPAASEVVTPAAVASEPALPTARKRKLSEIGHISGTS